MIQIVLSIQKSIKQKFEFLKLQDVFIVNDLAEVGENFENRDAEFVALIFQKFIENADTESVLVVAENFGAWAEILEIFLRKFIGKLLFSLFVIEFFLREVVEFDFEFFVTDYFFSNH